MVMINYAATKTRYFLLAYMDALTHSVKRFYPYLIVCTSNSDPLVVGKMYLRRLFETKAFPGFLRIDRGTEIGKMATIHTYLINKFGIMNDPYRFCHIWSINMQ